MDWYKFIRAGGLICFIVKKMHFWRGPVWASAGEWFMLSAIDQSSFIWKLPLGGENKYDLNDQIWIKALKNETEMI